MTKLHVQKTDSARIEFQTYTPKPTDNTRRSSPAFQQALHTSSRAINKLDTPSEQQPKASGLSHLRSPRPAYFVAKNIRPPHLARAMRNTAQEDHTHAVLHLTKNMLDAGMYP
jgi:hypothetical protein